MKKLVGMGLLALSVLACTQTQAPAYYKVGIGIGFNFNWESANNSWLWGAWKSGPPPGYDWPFPSKFHQYQPPPQGGGFAAHGYPQYDGQHHGQYEGAPAQGWTPPAPNWMPPAPKEAGDAGRKGGTGTTAPAGFQPAAYQYYPQYPAYQNYAPAYQYPAYYYPTYYQQGPYYGYGW
jgi:hypothetical protein